MLDLHIHTTASDGTCTPEEVVRMAKKKGFSLIAITDHDTMDGVKEAMEAGKKYNVEVIPGVEISAGVDLEVHMLGYGMSPDHPVMVEMMEDMRLARIERMVRMIENLRNMGIDITQEEVEALADGAIGRPHIARVLIAHGVVPDVRTAFREYIGLNAPAYAERRKMTSETVIRNIRAAGGVPVLAHGGLLRIGEVQLNQWIDHMVSAGMMYSGNTIAELAENCGVPAEALEATVAKFNEAVAADTKDEFGRTTWESAIDVAPFYSSTFSPCVHHTMGGLQINENTEVLDVNGNVIPGFYAAGEVTGGIHGTNRVGGNAVPDALCFGKIAGANAAAN